MRDAALPVMADAWLGDHPSDSCFGVLNHARYGT